MINETPSREPREVIYIDPAYALSSVLQRGQLQYVKSRDRGRFFTFVWGVHPFIGLMGNRWAKRIRVERFDGKQVIFDGFESGRAVPKWLIPINVLSALTRLFLKLSRVARRPEVKAIFAADIFACGLLGLALSKVSGKPLLVGVYGNQDENWQSMRKLASPRLLPSRRLEQFVSRRVLRAAELVEVGTTNMRNYVVSNGADPSKVAMLPVVKFISDVHYVDPDKRPEPFSYLKSRGIRKAPLYLLYVGRLKAVKHADEVIPAMEVVLRKRPDIIGLLAGSGELEPALLDDISRRGLDGHVFLLGDCDHPTLASLIPHCITLSPLTGMALIETSLGASAPVVYDRDWQPEFVKDGESGFVVDFRDAQAMGEKALMLAEDESLRRKFAARSRQIALDFADQEEHAMKERAALSRAVLG